MNYSKPIPTLKFIVPQILTALRLIVSSMAVFAVILQHFELAAKLIIIGIVVDSFDGPLAKKLKVTSEFGSMFDYYGDYVGNVIAPAIFVLFIFKEDFGHLAIIVAILPILTGAIRYSRNVIAMKEGSFEQTGYPGLGTVFFALFLVETIFLDLKATMDGHNYSTLVIITTPVFSLLMIAPWRYPKLTKFFWINIGACALIFVQLFAFAKIIATLVLPAILGYGLISPFIFYLKRPSPFAKTNAL
jgi:CDP-diacylglycerol--serine O-phosphatidyltransferase